MMKSFSAVFSGVRSFRKERADMIYTDRIFHEMELPERYNGLTLLFEGPFNDDGVSYYRVYYSSGPSIVWIGRASRLPLSFDEFRSHNKELGKIFP